MKFQPYGKGTVNGGVTLRVRVWIEISFLQSRRRLQVVTLRVRVWIEISEQYQYPDRCHVTLRVRVWIEIARVLAL